MELIDVRTRSYGEIKRSLLYNLHLILDCLNTIPGLTVDVLKHVQRLDDLGMEDQCREDADIQQMDKEIDEALERVVRLLGNEN